MNADAAKKIADRYIERGGYKPGERREQLADDVLTLFSYLGWTPDSEYWGGVRADEAFKAACRVLAFDAVEMRKIIRGEGK